MKIVISAIRVLSALLLFVAHSSMAATLAGSAHQEAFNQVAKADAVMVSEALQRDFDAPLLEAAFPGWPVEAGFELSMDPPGVFVPQSALGAGAGAGVGS